MTGVQTCALPISSQASASGKYLKSDGTNTSWDAIDVGSADISGTLAIANGGTGVTTLAALGNLFYPVGSIYSATVSTNPGTLLGFGTWTQFGAGRMMMGAGGSYAAGSTGGSANATLVSHTHTATVTDPGHLHYTYPTNGIGNAGGGQALTQQGTTRTNPVTSATTGITVSNSTEGSSATDANLPPYIVVYMWQRTA